MDYEWDEAKNRTNRREHGIDFAKIRRFEWDFAQIDVDAREDYGELRELAASYIGDVLHILVYTQRDAVIRVISLRKANRREIELYEDEADPTEAETGSTALITTGARCTPISSSSANAVSIISLTGVVSGSVTNITWQREGSPRSSSTSALC